MNIISLLLYYHHYYVLNKETTIKPVVACDPRSLGPPLAPSRSPLSFLVCLVPSRSPLSFLVFLVPSRSPLSFLVCLLPSRSPCPPAGASARAPWFADKWGRHWWGCCKSNEFRQLGDKGTAWHFWEDKSRLRGVPNKSLWQNNKHERMQWHH